MKTITKVLVGSRLHGLSRPDSDYDWRGVHMHPLIEVLSPFRNLKNTHWLEGEMDDTSYELADFCKQAVHGNATILEVLFSTEVKESSDIADEMRGNWAKFMDTGKFVMASRGYAQNQWNKFYNFNPLGTDGHERTAKFAVAFLRVMWQCEQFLLEGQFKCDVSHSDLFPLLKKIKPLSIGEIQEVLPEIVAAMGDMNIRVSEAEKNSRFKGMKADIGWIEDFIYRAYTQ